MFRMKNSTPYNVQKHKSESIKSGNTGKFVPHKHIKFHYDVKCGNYASKP